MLPQLLFCLFLSFSLLSAEDLERQLFQNIFTAESDSAKLTLIRKYISEYPTGRYLPTVYGLQCSVLLSIEEDSAAFYAFTKHLALTPRDRIVTSLSRFAIEFAQQRVFLDTALALIDSAIVLYEKQSSQTDPGLLHTKAFVLFQKKKYQDAEQIQKQAINLLPKASGYDKRYSIFYMQLGFIQLETEAFIEGIQHLVTASIVSPSQGVSAAKIDSLIIEKKLSNGAVAAFRDSLYRVSVHNYLSSSLDSLAAKSTVAVTLARAGVLPEFAESLAKESYEKIQGRVIQDRYIAASSRGFTLMFLKKYGDAEKYLDEAAKYSAYQDIELFLALGDVKEELGKKEEALKAYLTASLSAGGSSLIFPKIESLKTELYPAMSLDSLLALHQAELLSFEPQHYQRQAQALTNDEMPRVVLAELFTGSECRPCQAADYAFDYLSRRYDSSAVVILQYHLNIPLPDPLSNNDSEKRSEYYGVNSTPTAIFAGTTTISSGGNRLLSKNRFLLYSDIVERELEKPAQVSISLKASLKKDIVSLTANVRSSFESVKHSLRIALVEDDIVYKGSNEVPLHKFVVRKMVRSAEGFPIPSSGVLNVEEKISIKELEKELKTYLDRKELLFSVSGAKFTEKLYSINRNKLSVVAFVQNDETKEALQTTILKISP